MKPRLLLDANLSWRLLSVLKPHYDDCFHVDKIGLRIPAKDTEIWEYAKQQELVIVTNDEDFLNLSSVYGFPPKVVLFRLGNQSNRQIAKLLILMKARIEALIKSEEFGVLEII